jgi:radical SAM superfamily enzyme YgiQ (UPF0313 family)
MRLILTHGFVLAEDARELQVMKPYPPLGLLYLSSHLRRAGMDVEVYDSTFGSREELYGILRDGPRGAVGIAANLLTRRNVVEIAGTARELGWKVIVGGPEPANYPQEYLEAGAHVVVEGEGELTLEELIPALEAWDEAALERVAGIRFLRPDGQQAYTGPRPLIGNLDAQPWPDRERIDVSRYLRAWRERHGMGSVSLITARGCPFHCRWCSHSTFGKTHRRRSPAGVVDEVEWILDRYSPEMLWMADDVFTIHHGWILEYAAEMKRRRLRVPFECITRADRLNEKMAAALAELGCFRVWIGSESGSDRVLQAMSRNVSAAQVRAAVELCRGHGIASGMFLMWGYEGEGPEDIEATVEHVKVCRPDVYLTTVAYPIKGTEYYDEVAPRLMRNGEWSTSSDRELRVAGRHSRRFYQFADALLRSEMAGDSDAAVRAREGMRESLAEVEA